MKTNSDDQPDNSRSERSVDETDLGIIEALHTNPRITNKAVAAKLRVSETTVAQRIRIMSDRGVMRVVAQRDVLIGGYTLMCLIDIDTIGDSSIIGNTIAKMDNVISVSRCLGESQLLVNVRARDRHHLDALLADKIGRIGGIERVRSNICLRIIKFESGYGDLSAPLPESAYPIGRSRSGRILRMLLDDGRISNREIARQLDISEGSVRQRLKKLYDENEIRLGVVCDPLKLNLAAIAIVRMATRPGQRASIIAALAPNERVAFVGTMAGQYDLWALIQMKDNLEIAQFCEQVVSGLAGVSRYNLSTLVSTHMHRYDLVRIR